MQKFHLLFLLSVLLFSCKSRIQTDDVELARVNTDILYLSDISTILPSSLKNKDSIDFVESYVQKWIRDKIMYEKAALNLTDNQEDIEKRTESFRQSLYVYKYEQKLLQQKLKKNISEDEIQQYYDTHSAEFVLDQNICKPLLVQVSKKMGRPDKILPYFTSKKEEDLDKIKDFCYQYSNKFFFADKWTSTRDLIKELPDKSLNIEALYFSKQVRLLEDSVYYSIVKIEKLLSKGEPAPLEFVSADIKELLLQKRTQELIIDIRNKIYEDALKKNKIEIYTK